MMQNKPLVSILTTAYNREKYIAKVIDSILASTYQNWELIIVDDQSIDRTFQIAIEYKNKDSRIKVYRNEKNIGDYPNRNRAASFAQGKYLKFLDADDLIYPYGLELLVFYMEQFPDAGYGLCSLEQDKEKIYPFQLSPYQAYFRHYFEKSLFHKAPLSSIIKKEAFDNVGGFTGKQHIGDFEFWHLLSCKFPVVLMPHGIVWYREHDDQQMNDNRTDLYVPFKYMIIAKELLSAHDCPLSDEERQKAITAIEKNINNYIVRAFINQPFKKALQLKKAIKRNYFQLIIKAIFK